MRFFPLYVLHCLQTGHWKLSHLCPLPWASYVWQRPRLVYSSVTYCLPCWISIRESWMEFSCTILIGSNYKEGWRKRHCYRPLGKVAPWCYAVAWWSWWHFKYSNQRVQRYFITLCGTNVYCTVFLAIFNFCLAEIWLCFLVSQLEKFLISLIFQMVFCTWLRQINK